MTIPLSFIGRPFVELARHFEKEQQIRLIGILENTGNITSRKRDALREAQKNADISRLVPSLRMVKELESNNPVINPPEEYIIKKFARGIAITGSTLSTSAREAA